LIAEISGKGVQVVTYGTGKVGTHYTAENIVVNSIGGFSCDVKTSIAGKPAQDLVSIKLRIPGRHNILNALAALAVSHIIGLSLEKAAAALNDFNGTGRRFEIRGEADGIMVVDDYAHHPTEIKAVLSAARMRYPHREIWVVWQPHTYSRTRVLAHEFIHAFGDADHVVVTEIFPSRESQPADGYSASQVVNKMEHSDVIFIPELSQVILYLLAHIRRNDVLLVLSAGDADQISTNVLTALKEREKNHA
jgi:UDP-N-acetylmuramate--alanine ligase